MLWSAIYFGLGLITTALTSWQYERDGGSIRADHAVYLTLLGPIGLAAFIGQAVARAQKGMA